MSTINSHKDLVVWQKSIALASAIYRATANFPREERFALAQQMRRSAISVASNIAEGSGRQHRAELLQFLHIARGSLAEIETQTFIAVEQNFLSKESPIPGQIDEIGRMLTALIASLRNSR